MVFSSLLFLFYFLPVVLVLYFLARGTRMKNLVLFVMSLVFYAWGEPVYVFIMLFSTFFDYCNGLLLERYQGQRGKQKAVVAVSVVGNLAIMCFFKYTDFILTNLNALLGTSIPLLNLALPIGISFYTFQTMSYTIDVYRGEAPIQRNVIDFGTYVALFPQLIAGPIVRYNTIALQLNEREENCDKFAEGLLRFMAGLGKKVLLANNIGYVWDAIKLMDGGELSVATAWLGAVAFTFQIYFDFSGYSDMAIGLGKMFGFEFLENFNYPYISRSITEFWRRWHISLGTWFREYVYIPLGGNRVKLPRMYFNIFVVWFLTGLWHGASWNFVLWGLYYCVLLVIEKTFLLPILKKLPGFVSGIYTMFFVIVGWAIFAIEDLNVLLSYLQVMFGLSGAPLVDDRFLYYISGNLVMLVILIVASLPWPREIFRAYTQRSLYVLRPLLSVVLFVACVAYLVDSAYNPFLYFRF
ncbi:MAG: MBOAT family O-acyltransferase [Eubacteriales bacterium]|jgi:alginate O-acetyltransferase complex protein AlgI